MITEIKTEDKKSSLGEDDDVKKSCWGRICSKKGKSETEELEGEEEVQDGEEEEKTGDEILSAQNSEIKRRNQNDVKNQIEARRAKKRQ